MNTRTIPLVTGEYYHVFNRGVAKQPIFLQKKDYQQFILTISYYQFSNVPMRLSRLKLLSVNDRTNALLNLKGKHLVEIIAYCLMPNHFHFLLKQVSDHGISIFMNKFSNSYSKYFNTKYERVGPILQGIFKYVYIEDENQLIHVSRYIHLNPLMSYVVNESNFANYPWSSFIDYSKGKSSFVNLDPVLFNFKSMDDYKKFVYDQIDYAKKLETIKHLVLD